MKNGPANERNALRTGLLFAIMGWFLLEPFLAASGGVLPVRHRKDEATPAAQGKGSASRAPAFSIPVEPLGFYPPGPYYLGQREALVSLDFLGEDRLLFTFRAPGLVHRANAQETERQIRAKVLTLPQGAVESEALWTLHDHDRYLWVLRDGHFLLRDENWIKEGDSKLELHPLLEFPGPLVSIEMDPEQKYLITNSIEPSSVKAKTGQVSSPSSAEADTNPDNEQDAKKQDVVVRILDRISGQVFLVNRVRAPIHLPMNEDGYIATLPGKNNDWAVSFDAFKGGSRLLGNVNSSCQPPVEFVTHDEALVNTCLLQNGRRLIALSITGKKLWEASSPATQIWPELIVSLGGSRIARETILVDHSIEDFGHAFNPQDVKGQLVEVFDAAAGKLLLQTRVNPVLDGGGNVAISPSGNRVAILEGSAIEVYELDTQPESAPSKP